jgi:hypothetical protein
MLKYPKSEVEAQPVCTEWLPICLISARDSINGDMIILNQDNLQFARQW